MAAEQQHDLAALQAYADGELDSLKSLEVERHIAECASCSAALEQIRGLRSAIETADLRFKAPTDLERRIRTALHPAPRGAVRSPRYSRPLALAASAVFLMLLGTFTGYRLTRTPEGELVAREVIDDHVRSLMAAHLTDVTTSDKHTVKPWFAGKLDFSPEVKDLASQGFPLVGGRVDFLAGRSVAALVYGRHKHVIDLFTWPASDRSGAREFSRAGYNVVAWTNGDMNYWAVSDLNSEELRQFAGLLR